MNFKNSILVFSLFALLITACESKEEKALRELEELYKDLEETFNEDLGKAYKDFEHEMEGFGKDFENEMKKMKMFKERGDKER